MGFLQKLFGNTSKPEGKLGKLMGGIRNTGQTKVSDWGMTHLGAFSPRVIADIGCGDGQNASKLLERFPHAKLFGTDQSEVSVEKARETNRDAIAAGRCRIVRTDVTNLPFRDGVIDMVTAFETVYFWPGPADSFREIYRILSDDGVFVIVNETDGAAKSDTKWKEQVYGMNIYSIDELFAALKDAGFTEIGMDHDAENHNLCFLAMK